MRILTIALVIVAGSSLPLRVMAGQECDPELAANVRGITDVTVMNSKKAIIKNFLLMDLAEQESHKAEYNSRFGCGIPIADIIFGMEAGGGAESEHIKVLRDRLQKGVESDIATDEFVRLTQSSLPSIALQNWLECEKLHSKGLLFNQEQIDKTHVITIVQWITPTTQSSNRLMIKGVSVSNAKASGTTLVREGTEIGPNWVYHQRGQPIVWTHFSPSSSGRACH